MRPGPEHLWLHQLVGSWALEDAQGQPVGEEVVSLFGQNWVVLEAAYVLPGAETGRAHCRLGFDPLKGKVVGSWTGTMMNHHWVLEGDLDLAANAVSLLSEGPSFEDVATYGAYRDTYQLVDAQTRTLRSERKTPAGDWETFMVVTARRK